MQSLLNETKFILDKYNLRANKNLGQNFLIDENTVEHIVDAANICKEDLVIEIGPGLGTLTQKLAEKANKVICIELDKNMVNILKERFKFYKNIEIIESDVLKINLKEIIRKEKEDKKISDVKFVANLPYYITTPIIMKLLEDKLDVESITIMVQKEVAERLTAEPGSSLSGAISYAIFYYTIPEKVCVVPNTSFLPSPKVDSEVIKLNVLKKPSVEVENEEMMFKIIKTSFMQRRKTLINALYNGKIISNKEEFEKVLKELNIDTRVRGEKLSLNQYAEITKKIISK